MIAYATQVSFTAAVVQAPQIRGGARLDLLLGGDRRGGEHSPTFYQPAVALGHTAARLSRLGAGEAVTGSGTLLREGGGVCVLIQDIARLEPNTSRLRRDVRGRG